MARKLESTGNGSKEPLASKQKIIDAAVACFEQYGPQRTSMADIAEKAGVSRKTLYRIFEDRSALIEHILIQRILVMGNKIRTRIKKFENLEEALIEGSLISVEAGRKDSLFNEIIRKDTNHRVEQFLFRANDPIRQDMIANWSPVIERGRAQGLVRTDLTNERIIELIISVHSLLLMRDDYEKKEQRAFLKDFLVPAITK